MATGQTERTDRNMSTKVEVMEAALLGQRMRSDKHRENFEALKAQYINLQENHRSVQHRYAALSEQFDQLHAKSQEIITTLQQERDRKIVECEELKPQVLTAQKLEQLRQQWTEELEQQLRKKVESAESNWEATRGEYNKLVNSYAFLKSEYECAKATHESVLQEMKAKYDSEVASYVEQLRLARSEHHASSNIQEIRQLQRVNNELQQRVSSLVSELEEMQKERDKVYLQAEQSVQQHLEKSNSAQVHIQALEIERSSLASQVESLQSELSSSQDKQIQLQALVDQAYQETSRLHRQLEKAEAKYTAQMSNAKMQEVQECQKLEAAQERVLADQLTYQTQLELLQRTVREHEALLVNKDQEIEQRIQLIREKEWEKVMALQKEKIELEERLAEGQRIQMERDEENKCVRAKLKEQLQVLDTEKHALESEIRSLQAELQTKADQQHTTQLDLQRALHYKKKHQNLFTQYQSLQQREQELHGKCNELQSSIHLLENAVGHAQGEVLRLTEIHQKTMQKERKLWSEERTQLQGRLKEVEVQVRQLTKQLNTAKRTSNKLQNYYKKQVQDLRQSLELQKTKEEQITAEKEALKRSMDLDNKRLRNKCAEFKRKQDEFLLLLHSNPCSTTDAEKPAPVQVQYPDQKLDLNHRLEELHMTQLPSPTESLSTLSNRDL